MLGLLTVGLATVDRQLLADPPPAEDPVIIDFDAFETMPGEWEITGQVVNHDGVNTTVDFGSFLSGESTNTDSFGFFTYYCFGTGGETVSAEASCANGVSDGEFTVLD